MLLSPRQCLGVGFFVIAGRGLQVYPGAARYVQPPRSRLASTPRFPPVLNLQLKRFHFDLEKMDMAPHGTGSMCVRWELSGRRIWGCRRSARSTLCEYVQHRGWRVLVGAIARQGHRMPGMTQRTTGAASTCSTICGGGHAHELRQPRRARSLARRASGSGASHSGSAGDSRRSLCRIP